MKITTCTINVGNGEGNRNLVLDVLWFVDVFIILDCPTNSRGEYLEHENHNYELVSSVKEGDVEVYIRRSMVGWLTIESHNKEGVIMKYEEENTGKTKRIGAIYVRPLRETDIVDKRMKEMENCDLIIGDLNARNPIWGGKAGDDGINAYGRRLQQWMKDNNRKVAETKELTFRQKTVIDITIYKDEDKPPNRQLTDKCGLEHMGQIIRIKAEKPDDVTKDRIDWKKVDWGKVEEDLKKIRTREEEGWEDVKGIMESLPKQRGWKGNTKWWTKELEQMAKDTRKMRRVKTKGWETTRKVFRNMMINKRYEKMKMELGSMKDPDIFRAIKQLEGRRAIPPITMPNGQKIFEHNQISDMIAEQLNPSENIYEKQEDECDIDISDEEIEYGIRT